MSPSIYDQAVAAMAAWLGPPTERHDERGSRCARWRSPDGFEGGHVEVVQSRGGSAEVAAIGRGDGSAAVETWPLTDNAEAALALYALLRRYGVRRLPTLPSTVPPEAAARRALDWCAERGVRLPSGAS